MSTLLNAKSGNSKAKKSALLSRSDSLSETDDDRLPVPIITISPSSSRLSNGELNMSFKFGGLPKPSPVPSQFKLEYKAVEPYLCQICCRSFETIIGTQCRF